MLISKSNTGNVEMEEHYIKIITIYLNISEDENRRKYFDLNHKKE